MRGLQAVLYIAVLLCVAQFANAADCGTHGSKLVDGGHCVCLSGYSGEDCSIAAPVLCNAAIASATQADHFPALDLNSAAYTQNTLRVTLLGPHVAGRRYNGIHFVAQNESACSLGDVNTFWSTNFTAACQDSFHIDLPWSHHTGCGFRINEVHDISTDDELNQDNQTAIAEDHFVSFTAKFTLYYTDMLGQIENITLSRNTSVPYQIYVRFPTRLDVSLTNVNITSKVEMGFALTGDSFDPETHELTIELTIINNWPNMLQWKGESWDWGNIHYPEQVSSVGVNGTAVSYKDEFSGRCENEEGSVCQQSFQISFTTATCTYDGHYVFSIPLFTCRGGWYEYCTNTPFLVDFQMETSSVCSSINYTLPLTGNLVPFLNKYDTPVDAAMPYYNPATFGFTIGSYGHFQVQLSGETAASGNTIALEFFEISFQSNGLTNKNYLMRNGVAMNNTDKLALGNADSADAFHYDEARLSVNNAAKGFTVYFSSVVFKVLPSTQTVYTFRASAYATFLGNEGETKKREVDFVWTAEANQMSAWTSVALQKPATSLDSKQSVGAPTDNLAYIIGGGGAGLVLIVLAVIGLAIHQKRRQAAKALAYTAQL